MRASFLSTLGLLAACITTHAALTLSSGDVFTYEFSSLMPVAGDPGSLSPLGNYSAILNPTTVQPGDTILLEMFENSLTEAPIDSRTWTNQSLVICQVPNAWGDLQGAIRLTMLSGSATVDVITLRALTLSGGTPPLNIWESTFVPVPEPGTIAQLSVFLVAGCFWRIRTSKPSRTQAATDAV